MEVARYYTDIGTDATPHNAQVPLRFPEKGTRRTRVEWTGSMMVRGRDGGMGAKPWIITARIAITID